MKILIKKIKIGKYIFKMLDKININFKRENYNNYSKDHKIKK